MRVGAQFFEPDLPGACAVVDDALAAGLRGLAKSIEGLAVGVENGGSARRHHLREQPQLGAPIGLHGPVVVEMVARKVGEGGGRQLDPVEAVLFEPVARGFERQMLDPARRQIGQIGVQRDRVGRRQRGRLVVSRRADAEGAEARRLVPQPGPYLAGEGGDRSFAVGAGDAGDGFGLTGMKARRHQGETAARIVILDGGDAGCGLADTGRAEDGDGAPLDGLADEVAAVGPFAGQGGKKVTRPDRARIRAQAEDVEVAHGGGQVRRTSICVPVHQLDKTQSCVLPASSASAPNAGRARLPRPAGL